MPKMTIDKLALLMKESFDNLTEAMQKAFFEINNKFSEIEKRFIGVEIRLKNLEDGQDKIIQQVKFLELGQENILLKLDNKVDKIDLLRK